MHFFAYFQTSKPHDLRTITYKITKNLWGFSLGFFSTHLSFSFFFPFFVLNLKCCYLKTCEPAQEFMSQNVYPKDSKLNSCWLTRENHTDSIKYSQLVYMITHSRVRACQGEQRKERDLILDSILSLAIGTPIIEAQVRRGHELNSNK